MPKCAWMGTVLAMRVGCGGVGRERAGQQGEGEVTLSSLCRSLA